MARTRFAFKSSAAAGMAMICALTSSVSAARENALASGERAYHHHDYVLAAKYLLPLAEQGSAKAQTYVGFMYENGLGLAQNYAQAVRWLRDAADQGAPTAQVLLGELYDRGLGVKRDFVQAEIWLNLAAAHAEPGQRDYWAGMRDAVASKLSLDERAEAERRASDPTASAQK